MKQLQLVDFGAPLHFLVIAGKTHRWKKKCWIVTKLTRKTVGDNNTTQRRRVLGRG
ncbi:hypothetical protein GBA52_001042 [Prunus armeniaca]|nr:hypothetical protein GBA52_001042 [Prunus armeniaca]